MTGKWKALLILLTVMLLGLIACRNVEVREESEPEIRYVRIFDVEVQDEADIVFQQHYARAGVLKIVDGFEQKVEIPFANQIWRIEKETGIQIEYVMLKGWDELPAKLEEAEKENVTTIVLFNNSYDGSLIREANSGKYADMEAALSDLGFYDENAYNQTVLKSGITEKGQVLVPILYNVSGMVQGDSEVYGYKEWKEMAMAHAEEAALDYGTFLERLKESMQTSDVEEMDVPFLSAAFLEDKVDLFLTASGADLEACENQEELFTMLYDYLKCYDETQVKTKPDRVSNQKLYAQYIKENEEKPNSQNEQQEPYYLPRAAVEQLKMEKGNGFYYPMPQGEECWLAGLIESMMNRTKYFVECSSAEEVAYHSVFSMLEYRGCYLNGKVQRNGMEYTTTGNMNYWPIGILNSNTQYAAQPICYAAVANGGSTRLAAKVLQSIMNQPTDVKYGISVCNSSRDDQLEKWKTSIKTKEFQIRGFKGRRNDMTGEIEEIEIGEGAYWDLVFQASSTLLFLEDKEVYTNQITKQIDNIVVASIPDREVLAIWQDALTEAVDSGLSAEAGFELLCERMEKRNMEE